MFDPEKFTTPNAKPLPVVLLLDVSYSMSGEKIEHLNEAVEVMLNNFAQEEMMECEIQVSIITFGYQANLQFPYTKASQVEWNDLQAEGSTSMGHALVMAKDMIEDKKVTPSRAYRPAIILVSDGQPTDDWEDPLSDFISNGRSSKCDRFAMAIGNDADEEVLDKFIENTSNELFFAEDAEKIHEFFKYVTMSVTMRSKSSNPNKIPDSPFKLDKSSTKLESNIIESENKSVKSEENSDESEKSIVEANETQATKNNTEDDDYW